MKIVKRVFAILLTVIMLLGIVPLQVFAKDDSTSQVTVNNGELELNSSSTFGDIITKAINESGVDVSGDYSVTAIDFNDGAVTVNYRALDAVQLVLGIYDESTGAMLTYKTADLNPEVNEVIVTFSADELPDHFLAKAFIVDSSGAALCDEFVTFKETSSFEVDFENVTVDDFDADKVINFDESEETNFAVMSDDTDSVVADGKKNVLVSNYAEDEVYVFNNIDSQISSLKPGDIFNYDNGDETEVIIIKVKSITVKGTSATIVPDETSIDEVFDYVKIEENDDEYEMRFVPNYDESDGPQTRLDYDKEIIGKKISYPFGRNGEGWKINENVKVTGSLSFSCGGHIQIYYKGKGFLWLKKYFEVDVNVSASLSLSAKITAEMKDKKIKEFGSVDICVCPGLYISFKPAIVLKASVSITLSGTATAKFGFKYNNSNNKLVNTSKPLEFKPEIKISGEFFVGLDMSPYVKVIHEKVASAGLTAEAGIKIIAELNVIEGDSSTHTCKECIDGDFNFVIELSAFVKMLNGNVKVEATLWKTEYKIGDFYFSITYSEFGFGECPHSKRSMYFGTYPQSKVTNSATVSALNGTGKTWISYGYMSGAGTDWGDGSAQPADYMKYCDVTYNGAKYRGVMFSTYRKYYTNYQSTTSTSYTYQDDNGYYINTTYWFEYEPLKWRVLDPKEGLVVCENIIDSQAYSNTISYYSSDGEYHNSTGAYASDYVTSSIREWLNDDFYNTAFDSSQKGQISGRKLDNSSPYNSNAYGSASTTDKVFLLSYNEVTNSNYGFSSDSSDYDINRRAHSTDYAKCQGAWVNTGSYYQTADGEDTSWWWLRSPGGHSDYACYVYYDGNADYDYYVGGTGRGVRPALKISNLGSKISKAPETRSAAQPLQVEVEQGTGTAAFNGVSGNRYMLYSVTDFDGAFEITADNLTYISQGTAVGGKVTMDFCPSGGTTVIVGDFGGGIEIRVAKLTEAVEPDQRVNSVSIGDVELNYKDSTTLKPTVDADPSVNYTVKYESSNPGVAKVDENGKVTAAKKGSATITCTVTDELGNTVTDTCRVNVGYSFGQWLIIILLFGWIWYI